LPDLLCAVAVRIGRVRLELVDRAVDDRHPRRKAGRPPVQGIMVFHKIIHFWGWAGNPTARQGTRSGQMACWLKPAPFAANREREKVARLKFPRDWAEQRLGPK
jgi:hypothetical protein